jgi:hypothetical protein
MAWNETGGSSITDLSSWNDKPAGGKGFVSVAGGHLSVGGKRLQLLGANVTFGGNAPAHADADIVARRMARFGINIVRLHHMDTHEAPNGLLQRDGVTFDPDYLDKLDYFVAALKKAGIYVDLNLHVGRAYPGFQTWPGGDGYFKGVDLFHAPMIALQKDFARDILKHRNPYTGTTYADEPAVAIVEINNENGLFFEWVVGHLDGMSEPFRSDLTARWNAWLKQRYGTDAALKAAWGAKSEPLDAEMFTTGWQLQTMTSAKAKLGLAAAGVALDITDKGQEDWHIQLHQTKLNLIAGRPYTLTLRLKADHPMTVVLTAMLNHAPWHALWQNPVKVGTDWRTVTFTFVPNASDADARLSIGGLGFETGRLEIAEASLKPGGMAGLKPGEALGTIAISDYAGRFARTPAAQRDWLHFLWALEDNYWREMQRFLKTDLGVRQPIIGTQINFSPAALQGALDIVDGHAYWQHPHFPGRAWDPANWKIKNVPMAGAAGGGTISELALRRVPGKPFLVTEYNNPAPSDFQGETMPLIGAYSALQDWDGVFLFDFGSWDSNWHSDHIDSFFNSRANPVKLVSLIATAAMIRRGDVAAATPVAGAMPDLTTWIETLRQSPFPPGGDRFGTPKEAALVRAVGATADTRPVSSLTSETGELVWGKTVVIDSKRSKALIGARLGKPYDAHGVGLELTEARGDWGVITATVLEGKDFASPGRILITTLGQEENTGQQWTDATRSSVGRNWGRAPVLVEGLGGRITLPVPAARVTAWALDDRGNRKAAMAVGGTTRATIDFAEGYRTLWYEIEIK